MLTEICLRGKIKLTRILEESFVLILYFKKRTTLNSILKKCFMLEQTRELFPPDENIHTLKLRQIQSY